MIQSLLDTDLYKLTMQAVVFKHFAQTEATYILTNRSAEKKLNAPAVKWIEEQIFKLGELRFLPDEIEFLREGVPFLPAKYLEFLETVKLDPAKQVEVKYDSSNLDLEVHVKGPWKETILYEIPVLALISEAYFKFVDTDWDYDHQKEWAHKKALELLSAGCKFSEFGTRRRRSFETQRLVLEGIRDAAESTLQAKGTLIGTSNVYFAKQLGLKPIGTVAHELIMGVAAFYQDYAEANKRAMDVWLDTVGNANAGYALTDTFGTENFLKMFVPPYSDIYWGVRQDSGDPVDYTNLVADHYERLGYKPFAKKIIYSDSLNIELCLKYKHAAESRGLDPSFGIGTFFTNDFRVKSDPSQKSKPMNIVMKLYSLDGHPCVKLSDNLGKNMGPPEAILQAKKEVGYKDSESTIDETDRW